jgi:hypothetical protein
VAELATLVAELATQVADAHTVAAVYTRWPAVVAASTVVVAVAVASTVVAVAVASTVAAADTAVVVDTGKRTTCRRTIHGKRLAIMPAVFLCISLPVCV